MANVPEIRVRGFSDEWKQRKLNELIMYQSSNLTASDASDIGKYDLYDANTIIGKTNIEPIRSEYITVIKDGAGVGRIRVLPPNTMFIGTMGGLQATKSDLSYIYTLLSRFELGKECSGSTIPHIYFKDYGNNEYFVPTIEEQQTIGSYFAKIDNLIPLHQHKYESLVAVKKAMLEKMFPKEGETVPEIRFAGFTDPWEQRKLEDVARILGGNAWKASDYSDDGEYLVVTIANVSGEVIINDSVGNRISCDNPDVYLLNKDDILVSLTGNVGRVSKMSNIKGLLNQRVGKILPNNSDINADFLFHVLRNPHFERAMIDAGQGAAQKNIRNDDVLNYAFFLPVEKDEQNIIAHYFNRLDNLITLHQRRCKVLKNLKSALLNKMFVDTTE